MSKLMRHGGKMRTLSIALVATLGLLTGCASTPPYVHDGMSQTANLKSEVASNNYYMGGTTISLAMGKKNFRLFNVGTKQSYPPGFVQVPAFEPIDIVYSESMPGRYCTLRITTILRVGVDYSLVGGPGSKPGVIPFLPGEHFCQLGVVETQSRQKVPAWKSN